MLVMGVQPYRIDVLTRISGVDFADAWQRRVAGSFGDVPVHYISLEDLLLNKRSTGRDKDRVDASELERLRRER